MNDVGYDVLVYHLKRPEMVLKLGPYSSKAEARHIMAAFCGKSWIMNRREDLHTFGDIIIRMEKRIKGGRT